MKRVTERKTVTKLDGNTVIFERIRKGNKVSRWRVVWSSSCGY